MEKRKGCIPSRRPRPKPNPNPIPRLPIPLLPHLHRAQQGRFPILNEAWMHRPRIIFRVPSRIHDNLAQAASDPALLDGAT